MHDNPLTFLEKPDITDSRMVIGFTGWMDGGDVSTGTIRLMLRQLDALPVAKINPDPFYIYNVPGPMEVTTLLRPYVRIEDGLITKYEAPRCAFHCNVEHRLLLFQGKEPNMRWEAFAEAFFEVARTFDVKTIYFVGSFGGTVPHSRDPRLYTVTSDKKLLRILQARGFRPSEYEGPAGFVTHLIHEAPSHGIRVVSLVAEIPSYVQGRNPRCIRVVGKRLCDLLHLDLDLHHLEDAARKVEAEVMKIVGSKEELADMVHKLETEYDTDHLETEMGDLKEWLEGQGFKME